MGGVISITADAKVGDFHAEKLTKKTDNMTKNNSRIDDFVQLVFLHSNPKGCIEAIVRSPIAFDSFILFLLETNIGRDFLNRRYGRNGHSSSSSLSDQFLRELMSALFNPAANIQEKSLVNFSYGLLQGFLRSRYFNEWRRLESLSIVSVDYKSVLMVTTLPELQILKNDCEIAAESEAVMPSVFPYMLASEVELPSSKYTAFQKSCRLIAEPSSKEDCDLSKLLVHRVLDGCDQLEIAFIMKAECWLLTFMTAAYTLPIGVSLSAVRNNASHPLVYVNDCFANLMGDSRENMVGNPVSFFNGTTLDSVCQDDPTHSLIKHVIERGESMVDVLANREDYDDNRVAIVGIKPIMDSKQRRNCLFFITLLMEVNIGQVTQSYREMKNMMDGLPGILFME